MEPSYVSAWLQRNNRVTVTDYTCYKTIWWRSQMLEWVHLHKHLHGTTPYIYTLYHRTSSLLRHTTWTVHMYGWWKLYFGSSSSSACNWEGREILCLQTMHQMLSHLWLFKMKPSGLLSIRQCSSKCNGKDAAVCRSALHLGVHVVYSDSRFRSGKQGSYLVHQVWCRSRGKAVENVNFSVFAPDRWHCHPVAMPSVENLNELFGLDSVR